MAEFNDCPIGRRVEINVAKMQSDIEHIKTETREVKTDIKQILSKLDNLDSKFAKKATVDDLKNKINWATSASISALVGVVAFLLKYIFFQ